MEEAACAKLLSRLFREEYARMTAVLCRQFGLVHIALAEDLVSDTFLKAAEYWTLHAIPENPVAWLYKTARNKALDCLRRDQLFEKKIRLYLTADVLIAEGVEFEFNEKLIQDSQLAMIFAVCDPAIAVQSQVCLALQLLCGFRVEEIANAFLCNLETIKKRLMRARAKLRVSDFNLRDCNAAQISQRMEAVLKTIYLLFNEGYFSKTNDQTIRKSYCAAALRLAYVLTENELTNTATLNALLALLCFQSSRLDARLGGDGELLVFEEQDQILWDKDLIYRGCYFLVEACQGNQLSKYHLEAAIAYWHTQADAEGKWMHILSLYNQLLMMQYTPLLALNRTFALAKVCGSERAIVEAEKLNRVPSSYSLQLLGYLYVDIDPQLSVTYYEQALHWPMTTLEAAAIQRKIRELVQI